MHFHIFFSFPPQIRSYLSWLFELGSLLSLPCIIWPVHKEKTPNRLYFAGPHHTRYSYKVRQELFTNDIFLTISRLNLYRKKVESPNLKGQILLSFEDLKKHWAFNRTYINRDDNFYIHDKLKDMVRTWL